MDLQHSKFQLVNSHAQMMHCLCCHDVNMTNRFLLPYSMEIAKYWTNLLDMCTVPLCIEYDLSQCHFSVTSDNSSQMPLVMVMVTLWLWYCLPLSISGALMTCRSKDVEYLHNFRNKCPIHLAPVWILVICLVSVYTESPDFGTQLI